MSEVPLYTRRVVPCAIMTTHEDPLRGGLGDKDLELSQCVMEFIVREKGV